MPINSNLTRSTSNLTHSKPRVDRSAPKVVHSQARETHSQSEASIPNFPAQAKSPTQDGLPVRKQPLRRQTPIQNRVHILLVHIPKLSIRGQARLAVEVGVSRSTISRLVSGRINPSYRLARGVTDALERFLGKPLDMREVFSTDGTYLTPSGCALCRCHGCLPEAAWDEDGTLRPEWEGARPGDWSLARPQDRVGFEDEAEHEHSEHEQSDYDPFDQTERGDERADEWKEVR